MRRFQSVFKEQGCSVIGMIHVGALPGTPKYEGNWHESIEKAKYEANVYVKHNLDGILIENMHDVPYLQDTALGPETIACMTCISKEVRRSVPQKTPCGIQVLACGNHQALAIAKACDLGYIRAEGFVFGHVADEGYTNACAGQLLRYRKQIDAENVLILSDLKKKHSSHAITQDVSLLETAKAAEFFLTDGIVITGNSTGHAASLTDLAHIVGKIEVPLLIGSGVTRDNVSDYFSQAQALIVGSHFKMGNSWQNELCETSIEEFMQEVYELRRKVTKQNR